MLNYQQTMVTIIKVSALTRLWRAKCGESFEQRKNQCKLEARGSAQSKVRGEVLPIFCTKISSEGQIGTPSPSQLHGS